MARDMDMTDERYLVALKRIRGQIVNNSELSYYDDTAMGSKDTSCTWGLCSSFKEQWPDAEDHLWPDQFRDHGRVAPKYKQDGQLCPFDRRDPEERMTRWGCFYHCRIFHPEKDPPPGLTMQEVVIDATSKDGSQEGLRPAGYQMTAPSYQPTMCYDGDINKPAYPAIGLKSGPPSTGHPMSQGRALRLYDDRIAYAEKKMAEQGNLRPPPEPEEETAP